MKRKVTIILIVLIFSLVSISYNINVTAEYVIEGKVPILNRHIDSILTVSISANGDYFTTTTENGELYLFSGDSETELWSYRNPETLNGKISKNGGYIIARARRNLTYFSKDSNIPLWHLEIKEDILSFSINDDGRYVLFTIEGKASLIDGLTGDIIHNYSFGRNSWMKAAISGDGNYFIATRGRQSFDKTTENEILFFSTTNTTKIWNVTIIGGTLDCGISNNAGNILITQLHWTWAESENYSRKCFGSAFLFSKYGEKIWEKNVKAVFSWDMTSPGEYMLIVGGDPEQFYLLSNTSSNEIWTKPYDYYLGTISMSDNSDIILTAQSGFIGVYNNNGESLWDREIGGGGWREGSVKVSADGTRIIIGTARGEILLFDSVIPPDVNAGDNKNVNVNDNVSFSGIATDNNSNIIKYEWDFNGDGIYDFISADSNANANYSYSRAGTYIVRFKVTNDKGASSIDTTRVTVNEKSNNDNSYIASNGLIVVLILIILLILTIFILSRLKKSPKEFEKN